jgi:antitoxin component YwqK of YwqJK toxin-antitoxin module
MKQLIVTLIFVSSLQISYAQKKVNFTELDEFNGVTYVRYEQTPFTGIGIGYFGNGKKYRQIPYKDGRPNGLAKEWDIHGNLVAEAEYVLGTRYGRETQYYDNGEKKLEVYYQNGQASGTVTEWYNDGQLMSRGEVLNGKYLGKHTWWYPNGQIEQIIDYRDGVAEGKVQLWYDDGTLRKSTDFQKGQPNGKSIEWYRNGQKMNESEYVNGTLHGEFRYWKNDGRLLELKVYEQGEIIKLEDYNSASLRTKDGYDYVFNLLNANFAISLRGEKVEPVSSGGLAFYVDGSIVQFFTIPVNEFKGEQEDITKDELWKRFIEDEKNRVEYQLDTTVEITQGEFYLDDNPENMGLFWSFDLPVEISKGKLKIVQEQYIALKIGEQIIQINGLVLNANDPEQVKKDLTKIMNTLQIYSEPIDVVQYTKKLYGQ